MYLSQISIRACNSVAVDFRTTSSVITNPTSILSYRYSFFYLILLVSYFILFCFISFHFILFMTMKDTTLSMNPAVYGQAHYDLNGNKINFPLTLPPYSSIVVVLNGTTGTSLFLPLISFSHSILLVFFSTFGSCFSSPFLLLFCFFVHIF